MHGRLRLSEHGVHVRDLPVAAQKVDHCADDTPVIARGVRGVDHQILFVWRPIGFVNERPGEVEQIDGLLAVPFGCGEFEIVAHGASP